MKEEIIARRYAEAFASYAKDAIGIAKAAEELKKIKIILGTNPDFRAFLGNSEIIYDHKARVIDQVLKDYSEQTRIFVKLLIKKARIKNLSQICDYFRINYYSRESLNALLKTSYPLSLELIKRIKEKLEQKFNKKLNLHIELDASLLGGVQAMVGNTVIDGSVRRRLIDLREKLLTLRVN